MDVIKNYKVLATAKLCRTKLDDGFISVYEIDGVSVTDDNQYFDFCDESVTPLRKLLKQYNLVSTSGVGKNLYKSMRKLYKETLTTKQDWSYAVGLCANTNQTMVWLSTVDYKPFSKLICGDVVLFRLEEKVDKTEWCRYDHTIQDYRKKTVGDEVYYDPTGREDKYHDFRKSNDNKTFVQDLELVRKGKHGVRKLKNTATKEDHIKHNNELADAYNKQQVLLEEALERIAELEAKKS